MISEYTVSVLIVLGLVALVMVPIMLIHRGTHEKYDTACHAAGGVVYWSRDGSICIEKSAVIEVK